MQLRFGIRQELVRSSILVSLLCVLCSNSFAQDFKTIHPGVEYAHVETKVGNDPMKINLLRLDLKKVRLDVHHAFDKAIGVEPTSVIAAKHGAVAAINAGFFRLDKSEFAGDAAGILMIDGELISESVNDRVSFVTRRDRKRTIVMFGHYAGRPSLTINSSNEPIVINGINREHKPNEVVLYDRNFGATTKALGAAAELVLTNCSREKGHVGVKISSCRQHQLSKGTVNNTIPENGFVLALSKEFADRLEIDPARPAIIRYVLHDNNFSGGTLNVLATDSTTDITNGVPQLIKNGKIDITWEREKAAKTFALGRHPRTAVAKLKKGKFLMMTVDGRQPGISEGMTLQELAEYLLSLGATDAMNLDGGGSTTMYVDGKVVNTPSDKEGERRVSDAIVVTLRNKHR